MADGLNDQRRIRVAELLSDFQSLQYWIADAPSEPTDAEEYWTPGWATLRQCMLDGQHILNCGADTRVPHARGGVEEQEKAELQQVLLDAFSRRHEARKIWLRQEAAQKWVGWRRDVLQGRRPATRHTLQLNACDEALQAELSRITDEAVYQSLYQHDYQVGRWTQEDPSLERVQRWLRARR